MKHPTELELYTFLREAYEYIGYAEIVTCEDPEYESDKEVFRQVDRLKEIYDNANK